MGKKHIKGTQPYGVVVTPELDWDSISFEELANRLQGKIDDKLMRFNQLNNQKLNLIEEIEKIERNMHSVLQQLEPVEYLVKAQNPNLVKLFDSLKAIYGKENNEQNS